jgi:hypothetical protein
VEQSRIGRDESLLQRLAYALSPAHKREEIRRMAAYVLLRRAAGSSGGG